MNARVAGTLAGLLLGAGAARAAYQALCRRPPRGEPAWERVNHRQERVTLLEGPAYALGVGAGLAALPGMPGRAGVPVRVRLAGVIAVTGAGAFGAYDDLAGTAGSRGFAGHLGALGRGEVTSGAVKILGIGASGIGAASLLPPPSPRTSRPARLADVVTAGVVVAGCANLLNLFDLRPGRALKVGLCGSLWLVGLGHARGQGGGAAAVQAGAAAAVLPDDLGERAMLGDTGANALGAGLGVTALGLLGRGGRAALLAGVVALTGASEVISFTRVIDAVPPLRWADRLGRRPAPHSPGPAPGAASGHGCRHATR